LKTTEQKRRMENKSLAAALSTKGEKKPDPRIRGKTKKKGNALQSSQCREKKKKRTARLGEKRKPVNTRKVRNHLTCKEKHGAFKGAGTRGEVKHKTKKHNDPWASPRATVREV